MRQTARTLLPPTTHSQTNLYALVIRVCAFRSRNLKDMIMIHICMYVDNIKSFITLKRMRNTEERILVVVGGLAETGASTFPLQWQWKGFATNANMIDK